MNRSGSLPLLLLLVLLSRFTLASEGALPTLEYGPYMSGYRESRVEDHSRSFGPRTDIAGNRLPRPPWRPTQVHVWYPTTSDGSPTTRYGDYVQAVAPIGEPIAAPTVPSEEALTAWKAAPLHRGADEKRLLEILDRPTRVLRDADPATGEFPLILYSPSINSDPFENAVLFEFLASHGYVIAAVPSMGLDEAEVSRDAAGLRAQRDDLAFVLSRMIAEPYVDADHVAVLGFSWGGMAGLLFALDHQGVEAVACLDGGMRFPDYHPVAASFPHWSPQRLRAALLDVVLADEPRVKSFDGHVHYADVYEWSQSGLKHRDFAWDFIARYRFATDDPEYQQVADIYGELARRLKLFFDAYLRQDPESLVLLSEKSPAVRGAEWRARTKLPPPPTPAQFAQFIDEEGVSAGVDLFHRLRETDPALVLFEEDRLLRFVFTRGSDRSDELLTLLRLNLEAYPRSAQTHFWLAQVHLSRSDSTAAVTALEAALTLDPDLERATQLLERLRAVDPPNNDP